MSRKRISKSLIAFAAAGYLPFFFTAAQAADGPPPIVVATGNFIKAADQPWLTACEWTDADSKSRSSWTEGKERPGDKIVPASALCTEVKRFNFPGGQNLLYAAFQKGRQTPVQTGRLTNFMYIVSGHGHNMVDGQSFDSSPGDLVAQMGGKPHQSVALTDDYAQLDVVGIPTLEPGQGFKISDAELARGNLLRHKDAPKSEVCQYGLTDGIYKAMLRTPGVTIPRDAACFTVYSIVSRPGATVIEVYAKKGTKTLPHKERLGSVIYYVKGKVRATVDGETQTMKAGDATLHPGGGLHADEFLEDTIQLEIRYPKLDKTP